MQKFKLINEKLNHGVWWTELDLINLIKVCKSRNNTLYKKLVDDYEFLTKEKFKEKWLK